jgi:uncharacterized protein YjbI with pentapeptide repeats
MSYLQKLWGAIAFGFMLSTSNLALAECNDTAGPAVDWHGCNKQMTVLSGADLTGANLAGAFLSGTVSLTAY